MKGSILKRLGNQIYFAVNVNQPFVCSKAFCYVEKVPGFKFKGKVCVQAKWPIRPELIPDFCSTKRLGIFLIPLNKMLANRRVIPPEKNVTRSQQNRQCSFDVMQRQMIKVFSRPFGT